MKSISVSLSAHISRTNTILIFIPRWKLVLAAWGWLWGFKPGFSFANIGELYPDNLYMALRFLPMLAGALLPLVIFGIARQLKLSLPAAALAGILVALDNALLVQSRLILLDPFLLLFGFGALWCYLRSRSLLLQATSYKLQAFLLVCAGLLGGAAMSIKWTGITFLGLIIILEILRLWRDRRLPVIRYSLFVSFASLIVLPSLLYTAVFAVHFGLLTKSGAGDAFMSAGFQSTLTENRYSAHFLQPIWFLRKGCGAQRRDVPLKSRLTATHPTQAHGIPGR